MYGAPICTSLFLREPKKLFCSYIEGDYRPRPVNIHIDPTPRDLYMCSFWGRLNASLGIYDHNEIYPFVRTTHLYELPICTATGGIHFVSIIVDVVVDELVLRFQFDFAEEG